VRQFEDARRGRHRTDRKRIDMLDTRVAMNSARVLSERERVKRHEKEAKPDLTFPIALRVGRGEDFSLSLCLQEGS
jgi:hypothetical protein